MQVQINKPVTLGANTYGKGQHNIPDGDAAGWFFDALVKAGDIVVLREQEAKTLEAEIKKDVEKADAKRGRKKADAEESAPAEGE